MSLPKECHMPPLARNFAGLRNHSFLVNVFGGEPPIESLSKLTEEKQASVRRLRTLLAYHLLKCARHYEQARANMLAQIRATENYRRSSSGGFAFEVLDFPFNFDDCISSLDHIRLVSYQMTKIWPDGKLAFSNESLATARIVRELKNYASHMHGNIEKPGPVMFSVSEDGRRALLGGNNIDLASLAMLIHASFDAISTLFPQFSARGGITSPQTAPRLTVTAEIVVRPVEKAFEPKE